MKTYAVNVTRDGKWWMVAIPEINGLTQARRLSEAETMAREYIALSTDVPIADVAVRIAIQAVGDVDVAASVAEIGRRRDEVAALEAETRKQAELLAKRLAAAHVPVRDIGTLMGVSFQRAHQLVTAHH